MECERVNCEWGRHCDTMTPWHHGYENEYGNKMNKTLTEPSKVLSKSALLLGAGDYKGGRWSIKFLWPHSLTYDKISCFACYFNLMV